MLKTMHNITALASALLLMACAPNPIASLPELDAVAADGDPFVYRIQPGDQLQVSFLSAPELDDLITVRPDGRIGLKLLTQPVFAGGLTPEQLESELTALYARELIEPEIDVLIRATTGHRVYVGGEVAKPGVVQIAPGGSVLEAIILAGGLTDEASEKEVLVIRKDAQGRPVPRRAGLSLNRTGQANPSVATLAPTDVVYVPRSRIANANRFVEQYIRGLMMFDGFRISFGYDLDDPANRD